MADALKAVARVKKSDRPVHHTVVGDGPLRGSLHRLASELDLDAEVRFLGARNREEVATVLREAHILIAPSLTAASGDQEGIPNVLKEAMGSGLPVVSTVHSGIPELVEDGVSGYLVPERDVGALADRIVHLIDRPEDWPAMSRAERTRVKSEYSDERLNARLAELYEALVSS